ncbi:MAG: hypothetical protein JW875_02935 [Spirochaetales bacterium]|nr:hypothetical protein [Spirochaetales bacterium]
MRRIVSLCKVLVVASLALFFSCASPDVEDERTSLTIRFATRTERTVVADIQGAVARWDVGMTRVSDGKTASGSGSGDSITINDLSPGTWDITVTGVNASGDILAEGSQSGVRVIFGETQSVTVAIGLRTSGTGGYSLSVAVPSAVGVTHVRVTIDGIPFTPVVPYEVSGGYTRFTCAENGITAGLKLVTLEFIKGDPAFPGSTRLAAFMEAVQVAPGIAASRWIAPGGALVTERVYAEADFSTSSTMFASASFTAGANTSIDPSTNTYDWTNVYVPGDDLRFLVSAGLPGQQLTFTWNGGSSQTLASGVYSNTLPFGAVASGTLVLTVTASDGTNSTDYTFNCTRVHRVIYHPNGAKHPTTGSAESYIAYYTAGSVVGSLPEPGYMPCLTGYKCIQDGITMVNARNAGEWCGWGTNPGPWNGTETLYATLPAITSDKILYAKWTPIGGKGPGGGAVFYDKALHGSPFDKANPYAGGWRYLETKTLVDTPIVKWGRDGIYYGATLSGIGEGRINTAILKDHTDAVSAVGRCRAYVVGVYDDWYLPSTSELLKRNEYLDTGAMGFWSSTESSSSQSYNVAGSSDSLIVKTTDNNVSAVRSFAGPEPAKMVAYVTVPAEIKSSNGGSVPSSPQLYPVDQSIPVLGNIGGLTHIADFSFMGWSTRPGGRGTTYSPGTTLPDDSGDVVLYPRWNVVPFVSINYAMVNSLATAMSGVPVDNSDANRLRVNDILVYKLTNGNVGKIRIDDVSYNGNYGLQFTYTEWDSSGSVVVFTGNASINGTAHWTRASVDVFQLQNFTATERAIVMVNGSIIYYLGQ